MIIGITGGSGCGKTTALQVFAQLGGLVLDCDVLYHELLRQDAALLQAIESRFPGTVNDGSLDRRKLGNIVFSNASALQELNRLTHHAVFLEVKKRLEQNHGPAAVDAVGLFESGIDRLCQVTVAVTAPEEQRVLRLMQRDGLSREQVLLRLNAQVPQEEFVKRCTYRLHNDGSDGEFREKCLAFFQALDIMK